MGLFTDKEVIGSVYLPTDSSVTKKTTYPALPNFTIKINIIRINAEDAMIEGEELGEYRANIKNGRASEVTEGALIQADNVKYRVVNKPRFNKLFNEYKLNLKPV